MKNYKTFIKIITITLLSCYLLINECYCGELESGLNDSIGGTIQLLAGINKMLSSKNQITDPLSLTAIIADEIMNRANVSRIAPNLEELFKKFSHPSNLTIEDSENNNRMPFNYSDVLQNTENSYQYKTNQNIVEESTNYATTVDPVTEAMIFTNSDAENEKNLFSNNSTLEKFLSVQEDICYKVKYGIESIKNSQLVILFTKFLEYEYLKTKESWERIKITSGKIWESAINDEPQSSKSPNIERANNFLKILDQTKNQIQQSFFILKKPFSLIMRGVKNRFFNKTKKEDKDKDFCEKFYEAERKMIAAIKDFEKKFNKKLDLGIQNENRLLEEAKNNPDTMSYLDKETISNDIRYIKERIYMLYDYFKSVALNQLKKLQENYKL